MIKKIFLICILLLLGGCDAGISYENIPEKYAAASEIYCEAQVHTSYGVDLDFTLVYSLTREKETVTVLAPESIAGIIVSLDGGEVTFEETVLTVPLPDGYSACTVISEVVDLIRNDIPTCCAAEELMSTEAVVLDYGDEACMSRVWVAKNGGRLLKAEVYDHGKMIMGVTVNVWSMT